MDKHSWFRKLILSNYLTLRERERFGDIEIGRLRERSGDRERIFGGELG
jgi:hypothetical protein